MQTSLSSALKMKQLDFLKKIHDDFLQFSKTIEFDKKQSLHFNLVALYGSLIELSSCIIILLENNGKIGIPSIFRTFLETYVEYHNLVTDSNYGYFMEASHCDYLIKLISEAKKGNNPYFGENHDWSKFDAWFEATKTQLHELKKKRYEPLKIKEKFIKANMEEEYNSLYNYLSADSHCNIRALITRHAEVNENDFKVVYYKNEPIENFINYIVTTAELLVTASIKHHEFFKTGKLEEIKKYEAELNRIMMQENIQKN